MFLHQTFILFIGRMIGPPDHLVTEIDRLLDDGDDPRVCSDR